MKIVNFILWPVFLFCLLWLSAIFFGPVLVRNAISYFSEGRIELTRVEVTPMLKISADAVDFVGWYVNQSLLRSKISKTNAYRQYLAYHEGHGGYNSKTYENKAWLIDVAKNVEKKSNTYKSQLSQCRTKLDKNRVWTLF